VSALKGIKSVHLPQSEDIKRTKTVGKNSFEIGAHFCHIFTLPFHALYGKVPKERCPFPADFAPVKGDKVSKFTFFFIYVMRINIHYLNKTHNAGDLDFGALQRICLRISY
jgi:hypothetical protein